MILLKAFIVIDYEIFLFYYQQYSIKDPLSTSYWSVVADCNNIYRTLRRLRLHFILFENSVPNGWNVFPHEQVSLTPGWWGTLPIELMLLIKTTSRHWHTIGYAINRYRFNIEVMLLIEATSRHWHTIGYAINRYRFNIIIRHYFV